MNFFMPNLTLNKITDISFEMINKLNVKLILIDADNTLSRHGSQTPHEGVLEWIEEMKKHKLNLIIISNNFKRRLAPFAKKLDLPYISFSLKPLPFKFYKIKRKFNLKPEEILLIGDQIFTDVLGANLAGIKSILLNPLFEDKGLTLRLKRVFEKPIRKKIKRSNRNEHTK